MAKIFVWCSALMILCGCNSKKDYDAFFKNPELFSKTAHELNTVVLGNNFSPIVASRNYLYANVAAYEVIAGGYPDQWNSFGGQLRGLGHIPAPPKDKRIECQFASLLALGNA